MTYDVKKLRADSIFFEYQKFYPRHRLIFLEPRLGYNMIYGVPQVLENGAGNFKREQMSNFRNNPSIL